MTILQSLPRPKNDQQASWKLQGIVPPLLTPLESRDAIDPKGLERLIDRMLLGGVHGLFILGTTGEGPSLSSAVRRDLIDRTCRQVSGHIPVLVGITDTSLVESLAVAQAAALAGATAVVAAPPFYFPAAQQPLIDWFRVLAKASPLPLVLYNMPQMTKLSIDPESIRILTDCESIIGIKDSSGDLDYFDRIVKIARTHRPDWFVLVGTERLLEQSMLMGGQGGVPGGANIDPSLFVSLYNAISCGDTTTVERCHQQVMTIDRLYRIGRMPGGFIVGLKEALSRLGICTSVVASPFESFDCQQSAAVEGILRELNLISSDQSESASCPPRLPR